MKHGEEGRTEDQEISWGGGGDAEYKARHLTFSDVYDVSRMTVAIWLPILQLAFIMEAFTMHTGCVLGLHCCS